MMRIRLAENFRAVFYAPFYVAQALGFYAREGVAIDFVESSAPGDGVSALLKGTVDLTWGGPMRVMKAREEDSAAPLVCFGEVVGRDPFCLIGRRPTFALADLRSLRFAAVSEVPTPWMCLQQDLREQGIDPATLALAPGRTMADNFQALCRGELDIIQAFEPFITLAADAGAGDVLNAASARGPTTYTTFITTRDRLGPCREAFAGMVRAVVGMQDWLVRQEASAFAAAASAYYPDIAPAVLVRALARYRDAGIWSASPVVSRQGFARLAASLRSGGYIARMSAYEDCVTELG
jgi:NitT/TauT family transport system substrate-binding protein